MEKPRRMANRRLLTPQRRTHTPATSPSHPCAVPRLIEALPQSAWASRKISATQWSSLSLSTRNPSIVGPSDASAGKKSLRMRALALASISALLLVIWKEARRISKPDNSTTTSLKIENSLRKWAFVRTFGSSAGTSTSTRFHTFSLAATTCPCLSKLRHFWTISIRQPSFRSLKLWRTTSWPAGRRIWRSSSKTTLGSQISLSLSVSLSNTSKRSACTSTCEVLQQATFSASVKSSTLTPIVRTWAIYFSTKNRRSNENSVECLRHGLMSVRFRLL